MDQVIAFLDSHSGSAIVLVTLAYVVVTLLLLIEARANRATGNVANLEVYPQPFAAMHVELVLENYGPAIAKSVSMRRWTEVGGKTVEGTEFTQAEPMFPVGRQRRFVVGARGPSADTLQAMADQKAVLCVEWRWTDARRRFWFRTPAHTASAKYPAEILKEGFYGGWALRHRDPDHQADMELDEAKKSREALQEIAHTLKAPAMAAYIQQMLKAEHDDEGDEPPADEHLPSPDERPGPFTQA